MDAGQLRHPIELYKPVREQDAFGAPVGPTTDRSIKYADTWAKIEPTGGGEEVSTDAVVSAATHKVTIRYRTDIAEDHHIVHRRRVLQIDSMNTTDELRVWIVLMCREAT